MKLNKSISILTITSLLVLSSSSVVLAKPGKTKEKGHVSPGTFKNKILKSSLSEEEAMKLLLEHKGKLPAGIRKEIFKHLRLSKDSIKKLECEGIFDNLPKGILKNIMSEIDNIDEEEKEEGIAVTGEITKLDLDEMIIWIDDVSYEIPENMKTIIDDELSDFENLEIGMTVNLRIRDDRARIKAKNIEHETIVVKGVIEKLDLKGTYHITIDDNKYELLKDAQVFVNKLKGDFDDLDEDLYVVLEIEDNKITKVHLSTESKIEGEITALYHDFNSISIDDEVYKIREDAEIKLNYNTVELADLELDMDVYAVIWGDEIVEILAFDDVVKETYGRLTDVDLRDNYIEVHGIEYKLASDIDITIDGFDGDLDELIVNMQVEIELKDDRVISIVAETVETKKVSGKLTSIDLSGIYHLSVDYEQYNLFGKAIVIVNNDIKQLKDLQLGSPVLVYLVGEEVVKIEATNK